MNIRTLIAAGSIAAVPYVVLAQGMPGMPGMAPQPAGTAQAEFMAAHEKMMTDCMDVVLTGNADRDFALLMIPHHQGAVDMAQVELKYGTDPQLREMAQMIVDSQQAEIEELQKWLADHPQ